MHEWFQPKYLECNNSVLWLFGEQDSGTVPDDQWFLLAVAGYSKMNAHLVELSCPETYKYKAGASEVAHLGVWFTLMASQNLQEMFFHFDI